MHLTFFNERYGMEIRFSKYHGTGNDFIMVDGRNFDRNLLTEAVIAQLCDRHFGIGADGLILLEESDKHDFRMVYYNSDGKEGSMCGNGGRCISAFAKDVGMIDQACSFEAVDGLHNATVLVDGSVRLSLNNVEGIDDLQDGLFLDTGSPHLVVFRMNIDEIDVCGEGRGIRNEERFAPGGTNVNFVELMPDGIKVRTYERGVENETLSCGTGVTASAIAAYYSGLFKSTKVPVSAPGGKLLVEFDEPDGEKVRGLYLTGPAEKVFSGIVRV